MGKYEDQLTAMGYQSAEWHVQEFASLEDQMAKLKSDMAGIADNPGWTGVSADAARALFLSLNEDFARQEAALARAKLAIDRANSLRRDAAAKKDLLPDASVPDWIHTAALVGGTVMIPVIGIGTFAAELVVQKVNEFMSAQREAAAYKALSDMRAALEAPRNELQEIARVHFIGGGSWPDRLTTPEWDDEGVTWNGDDYGRGAWSTNGGGVGIGGGGGGGGNTIVPENNKLKPPVVVGEPPYPPIVLPPEQPPTVSIDGDTSSGLSGGGGFGGGGGLGAGLAGAGAGGLGAAKLASKGGVGSLFGGNGAGAGAGAGAAGRGGSNSAMMGGHPGGAGGGGSSKEKRSSLGLVAPKLEDDEETGPRSAAAGAGGRD